MYPRHNQDAAPRSASGYNVLAAGSADASTRGQRHDQSKVPASRSGRPSTAIIFAVLHGHKANLPRRKFPMSITLFYRLIALPAFPKSSLLCASLLAILCLLYVSGFRKVELIAYLPERATWLMRASLLWVIGGISTEHPTP
eukprot:6214728-Pleurochrysis_carterae.AAC.4